MILWVRVAKNKRAVTTYIDLRLLLLLFFRLSPVVLYSRNLFFPSLSTTLVYEERAICFPADRHLGSFQLCAVVNKAAKHCLSLLWKRASDLSRTSSPNPFVIFNVFSLSAVQALKGHYHNEPGSQTNSKHKRRKRFS